MPPRSQYSSANCSIARTLAIVGERWTLLVLREAFYGVRRFDDMQRNLGVARNVLTTRLRTLVEHDLLERVPYREAASRQRFEYRLTARGRDLFPALLALMQWGDRYLADDAGPAVIVEHERCGAPIDVELTCQAGHRGLSPTDAVPRPGPGARLVGSSG